MPQSDFLVQSEKSSSQKSQQTISQLRSQLLRYCEFLTGSRDDAEDLVQTAMLKALPVFAGPRAHPNATALLFRIAKNAWFDLIRKERRHQSFHVASSRGLERIELVDQLPLEEAMQILILKLTPQQRTVILLCDVFQYKHHEAAELLGISIGAVKATLHRARLRLKPITESDETSSADEPQKEILAAYIAAFQAADIRMLLQLCQGGVLDPVLATTKILTLPSQSTGGTKTVGRASISMRLAA